MLRILGPRAVQLHLVGEVQEVYRSQGVSIHDKHIEIIIRQMLKRVNVLESGATEFLPGALVERAIFESENRRLVAEGGEPASARPVLMGITKASLATESWLSAASFQETTRVLTDAAISARSDSLLGLKENVIIGKLIPAGTGIARYRNVRVEPTEEAKAAVYSMAGYDEADYAFGAGSGQAVPLEDYDYRDYRSWFARRDGRSPREGARSRVPRSREGPARCRVRQRDRPGGSAMSEPVRASRSSTAGARGYGRNGSLPRLAGRGHRPGDGHRAAGWSARSCSRSSPWSTPAAAERAIAASGGALTGPKLAAGCQGDRLGRHLVRGRDVPGRAGRAWRSPTTIH